MRVTDEMVEAAVKVARDWDGADAITHAVMRAALHAALSHAAGQEAVAWFTDDHLRDKSATTYDLIVARRWRQKGWPVTPMYLTPAQPPASAGVGRDAERLDWLAREFESHGAISANRYSVGVAGCNLFTVTSQHVRGYGLRGAIDAAMAASSWRKGGENI